MKLVMTLIVRDEEDIISANIEYHYAMGVDHFIVLSHCSKDTTPQRLMKYADLGILELVHSEDKHFQQSKWATELAHKAYRDYKADWVINNDADEFWCPHTGNLKDSFELVPSGCSTLTVNRTNFLPVEENGTPFFERMVYRELSSLNSVGKELPPKMCQRGSDKIIVGPGSHEVAGFEEGVYFEAPFDVVHYPLRTYAQFENKIVSGAKALDLNITKGAYGTWLHLYKIFQEGGLQDYYANSLLNEELLSEMLRDGTLLKDTRVKDVIMNTDFLVGLN